MAQLSMVPTAAKFMLHGPAASVCSAERRRPSAARRSRKVDIVHIFLHRIDGNRSGWKEASCSAQASSGCNRRPHGTSGDPGGPRGATSVCGERCCVRVPVSLFSLYRRVETFRHALEKMHLSGLAAITKPPTHFPMSLLQTPDIRARISLGTLL